MNCKRTIGIFVGLVGLFTTNIVWADGSQPREPNRTYPESEQQVGPGSGEGGRFLPGEEVVTSTGKKMKVWSTQGPVPVARPPQPFEEREKSIPGNVGVVVDDRNGLRNSIGGSRGSSAGGSRAASTVGNSAPGSRASEANSDTTSQPTTHVPR